VAEGAGLENRYTGNGIVGSNPTLSVSHVPTMHPTPAQRAGCLLGLALGDALGFVVEAEPPRVAADYVENVLRTGRAGERSHPHVPFGQYSDDTQLARELLLTIHDAGRFDPAAFGRRLAALFSSGGDVGAGPGTRSAALRIAAGISWMEAAAPAPYAGNGSAMRAAPLGLVYAADPAELIRVAAEQSRVTHRDSRCAAGAVAIAGAAALASRPGRVEPDRWLGQLGGWVRELDVGFAEALEQVARWVPLSPDRAAAELHLAGLDPASAGIEDGISAHVVPSVAWAVYAFLRSPDSWWDAVCTAIAVGGDTDTMAAMTGAVAGARLGAASLPGGLVERVNDRGRWGGGALAELAQVERALD
jgi:ADP-ribosylglycohydrolase